MYERFCFDLRAKKRRAGRFGLPLAFLAFVSLSLFMFLDSRVLSERLTKTAAVRTAMRLSTSSSDSQTCFENVLDVGTGASDAVGAARRDRDATLVASARQWLGATSRRSNDDRRAVVLRGLARWNVAPSLVAPFMTTTDDAALFLESERAELISQRVRTVDASRDAASAIAELAEDDLAPELEDALTFLSELGSDDVLSEATSDALESAFLWSSSDDARDPIDVSGYVVAGDFALADEAILALRLCDASARLFLFLTLGVLPAGCAPLALSVILAALVVLSALSARADASLTARVVSRARRFCHRYDPLLLLRTVRLLV